jgi:hypothetical protein
MEKFPSVLSSCLSCGLYFRGQEMSAVTCDLVEDFLVLILPLSSCTTVVCLAGSASLYKAFGKKIISPLILASCSLICYAWCAHAVFVC